MARPVITKRSPNPVIWRTLALAAIVAAGCAPGASTPPATGTPEPEARMPGTIAFLGSDGNVLLMAPDGSDQRPLTDDAEPLTFGGTSFRHYEALAWAPGSGHLAFVGVTGDGGGIERSQVLVAAGPAGVSPVFERPGELPFYLFWSPDGSRLSFLASSQEQTDLSLWIVSQSEEPIMLDQGQPYYWDWSPDGQSLLAHVGGSAAVSPGEARVTRFAAVPGSGQSLALRPLTFQAPAYEPQGWRSLVAAGAPDGSSGLLLLDRQGSPLGQVAQVGQTVAFDWSPSGRWAAFVEQDSDPPARFGELILLDLDQPTEPRLQPTGLTSVAAFFWSPQGDRLLAIVPVRAVPDENQLVSSHRQTATWRLRLYLVEPPSGQPHFLTEVEPTSDFLALLPFYDQYQRSSRLWSPDGEWLVLPIVRQGGDHWIARLEASPAGSLAPLAPGELAFWSFE